MPEAGLLKVSVAPADSDGEMHEMEECTPEMVPSHFAPWQRPSSTAMMLAAAAAEDDMADTPARAIKKQAWTPEEDAKLLAMVEHHGPSSWSQIALHLPGRVGKQCRERWHNHLSPEVKKENFTEEEDRLIMEAVAEHGTKWALIVKLIPGRTDNAIKNRWNSATRKLLRMQKREGKAPAVAGVPTEDAMESPVDISTMGASELARHLLATGLNPREPRLKRKPSVPGDRSAKVGRAPGSAQAVGGLDLLSSLATTDDDRHTSPAGFRAAMSLVQSLTSAGKSTKRPRAARSLLVGTKWPKDGPSSPRRMEAATCLGIFASGSEAAADPDAASGLEVSPADAPVPAAGSLGVLSALAAM